MAGSGEEVLVLAPAGEARHRLVAFLDEQGFLCTGLEEPSRAVRQATRKFFPVILCELDLVGEGTGLEVLRSFAAHSPASSRVLLTGRRSFEAATSALRSGVVDVLLTEPGYFATAATVVRDAAARARISGGGDCFLHEESYRVLDDAFRLLLEQADEAPRRSPSSFPPPSEPPAPRLLLVDSDHPFVEALVPVLGQRGWQIDSVPSGGAAFERLSAARFDLVVCRDELPDLDGMMVVRTAQAQEPSLLGVVFGGLGGEGRAQVLPRAGAVPVVRPLTKLRELLDVLDEMVADMRRTSTERRRISAFRARHGEFFRQYAELRLRLARVLA